MKIKEVGATIYICEGTKERQNKLGSLVRRVELCNTNPKIIQLFLKYLRTFNIDEKKLRMKLFIHYGDNEEETKQYWSKITGIPLNQFIKTQWRKTSKWRKRRLSHGTIAVRLYNAEIFKLIMKDIDLIFS